MDMRIDCILVKPTGIFKSCGFWVMTMIQSFNFWSYQSKDNSHFKNYLHLYNVFLIKMPDFANSSFPFSPLKQQSLFCLVFVPLSGKLLVKAPTFLATTGTGVNLTCCHQWQCVGMYRRTKVVSVQLSSVRVFSVLEAVNYFTWRWCFWPLEPCWEKTLQVRDPFLVSFSHFHDKDGLSCTSPA